MLSVGPEAKVFEQGTSFAIPPRSARSGAAPRLPQPDRQPEPLGELIARLGTGSAQKLTFRDGPDGEPVTSTFIFARVHAAHGWLGSREDRRRQHGPEWRTDAELPHARNG